MRYINADKTIEIINSEIEQCKLELEDEDEEEEAYTRAVNARLLGLITCLAIIKSQPTADVVEVVHAEWGRHYNSGTRVNVGYVCTCCDMWNERRSNDCPNCGAKMDKESEK